MNYRLATFAIMSSSLTSSQKAKALMRLMKQANRKKKNKFIHLTSVSEID
jgi:hypothetical protein